MPVCIQRHDEKTREYVFVLADNYGDMLRRAEVDVALISVSMTKRPPERFAHVGTGLLASMFDAHCKYCCCLDAQVLALVLSPARLKAVTRIS